MFLEKLSEFDFLDFGENFDAYVVAEFNKEHTKAEVTFNFKEDCQTRYNPNGGGVIFKLREGSQVPKFSFSDFNIEVLNGPAAIVAGRVRDEWYKFMKEKFGNKYEEAYKQNNKKDYNNKDLLDLDQK